MPRSPPSRSSPKLSGRSDGRTSRSSCATTCVVLSGDDLVEALLEHDPTSGEPEFHLRYYRAKTNAYMPIEFSSAAYRFGHSQVRGVYDLNDGVTGRPMFVAGDPGPLDDLLGRRPLPSRWTIDWKHFVDLPGAAP